MALGARFGGGQRSRSLNYTLLIGSDSQLGLIKAITNRLDDEGTYIRVSSIDEAKAFARVNPVVRVVASKSIQYEEILDAQGQTVPMVYAHDVLNTLVGRVPLATMDMNVLRTTIDRPRPRYVATKRMLDLGIAFIGLLIGAIPAILVLMLAQIWRGLGIRLNFQEVVGLEGVVFRLPSLTARESEASTKTMLRARHIMRSTGLEFLPSLLIVLSGRMSLVGPRPVTPARYRAGVERTDAFALRCLAKPGLVGLPQVRSFHSDAGRDARIALEYDLYYLAYRSTKLDLRILVRGTIILVKSWMQVTFGVTRGLVRRAFSSVRHLGRNVGHARFASVPLPVTPQGHSLTVEPCVVVGAGSGGKLLIEELRRQTDIKYWPIAILDDDVTLIGQRIANVPVVGNVESLPAVAAREQVDTVLIAIPSANDVVVQRITQIAQSAQLRVLTMPSIASILEGEQAGRLQPVQTRDLLGRPVVLTNDERAKAFLMHKRVLVTGAAGSIGSEVVRQAMRGEPAVIIGLDNNESGLFDLQQELRVSHPDREFVPVVASIVDEARLDWLMQRYAPQVIFHAAAYKHVPLMEQFPYEAIATNVQGTAILTASARRFNVERFVMVSTDKAVRPSSVMGASKRIAELIVRDATRDGGLSACAVRFGNVLGSRGSVIPLFEKQIADGGPLTITDVRMTRYFMTIPEAAGLIIEAGAFGDSGVTYMLDMGDPVKIVDVAERLIQLHGKRPGIDVEIVVTGLRPGEKLFEELSLDFETARLTDHPKIRILDEGHAIVRVPTSQIIERLSQVARDGYPEDVRDAVLRAVMEADGIDTAILTTQTEVPSSSTVSAA